MVDPAYGRAAHTLARFLNSPEARHVASVMAEARRLGPEREAAAQAIADAERLRPEREYAARLIDEVDSHLASVGPTARRATQGRRPDSGRARFSRDADAEAARQAMAIQGLTTLSATLEQHVRSYRSGVQALARSLDVEAIRTAVEAVDAAIARAVETRGTPLAEGAPVADRPDQGIDVTALAGLIESDALTGLDIAEFEQATSEIPDIAAWVTPNAEDLASAYEINRVTGRQIVLVLVVLAVVAAIVAADKVPDDGLLGNLDVILQALGLPGVARVAQQTGKRFDERYPPHIATETDPETDYEEPPGVLGDDID